MFLCEVSYKDIFVKNNKTKIHNLSIDEYDEINNPPPELFN